MLRCLGVLLAVLLLVGCQPAKATYHELLMHPEEVSEILQHCERGSQVELCKQARRARRETQFLLTQLRRSPEGFGRQIMHAQAKLSELKLANAAAQDIQSQQRKIEELQFITELEGR